MTELLKQPEFEPVPVEEQVIALYAGSSGALDEVPLNRAEGNRISVSFNYVLG